MNKKIFSLTLTAILLSTIPFISYAKPIDMYLSALSLVKETSSKPYTNIYDTLIKIANNEIPVDDPCLKKLSLLYYQHTKLDAKTLENQILPKIKKRYHALIKAAETPAEISELCKIINTELYSISSPNPAMKTKESLKDKVDTFCNDYIKYYSFDAFEGYDLDAKTNGFFNAVDLTILRAYEAFKYQSPPDKISLLKECIKETKYSIKLLINESKLIIESKEKILEKINSVNISSIGFEDLYTYDGLIDLELKDNFIESIISLRKIKENQKLPSKYTTNELNMILEISRYFLNSAGSFSDGNNNIGIVDKDIQKYEKFAETLSSYSKGIFSERDILKWQIKSVTAHEFGHIIDRLCGTQNQFFQHTKLCTNFESKNIKELKDNLANIVNKKCIEESINWDADNLPAKSEIFADFVAYNSIFLLAKSTGLSSEQISFIFTRIFPVTFSFNIGKKSSHIEHPPHAIRFDSTIGANDWLYDLGIQDLDSSRCYISKKHRLHF